MPRTADSLSSALLGGGQMTRGAAADYGFDAMIYRFVGKSLPSNAQINSLTLRLSDILKDSDGVDKLHNAVVNKTLRDLLGSNFDWVRTNSDLTIS